LLVVTLTVDAAKYIYQRDSHVIPDSRQPYPCTGR